MQCRDCLDGHYGEDKKTCEYCKRMQKGGDWIWEIDNGSRMVKCPDCEGRLRIGPYIYENPYRFCPYCGRANIVQNVLPLMFLEA